MLRHQDIEDLLAEQIGHKIKQSEIAEAIFLENNYSKKERTLACVRVGKRAQRNSPYSAEEIYKLAEYCKTKYCIDLISELRLKDINISEVNYAYGETASEFSAIEQITEATKDKTCSIPYYTNAEIDSDIITNPFFTDLILDLQKVINVYGATPENLRFIAMLGDEMDGGNYPIKNNDLLVIDTSITDLSTTGIYFCKTTSGVFIRRIAQLVADNSVYLSVDNPFYSEILNKKLNMEQLAEVGFTVLGKVIGNESIKL